MITTLVGHRGVGKTALLARIEVYLRELGKTGLVLDLDAEVARQAGRSVAEIFAQDGEARFRERERARLAELATAHERSREEVFIAVGAGYTGDLPRGRCFWVRRATDESGRIFVGDGRPRLDAQASPLAEFQARFAERQLRFTNWSDTELLLSEGAEEPNADERALLFDQARDLDAALTLTPEYFSPFHPRDSQAMRRLAWGLHLELRDDLLDPERILSLTVPLPVDRFLVSLRRDPAFARWVSRVKPGARIDWPAEWGRAPDFSPAYYSLHERTAGQSVAEAAARLAQAATPGAQLKLALEIHDFEELIAGHHWASADPTRRSFLPRSADGRWRWYRLLRKGHAGLNFVREGDGSAPDQPTLLEWMRMLPRAREFAAVLGWPVAHSRTPVEQDAHFRARGWPVLAIPVREAEWEGGALAQLQSLGLRAAAVTSPLKELAARVPGTQTPLAERLGSVNTLMWQPERRAWQATNTDFPAFEAIFAREIPVHATVAVWGGGGMLPLLRALLPSASFYSARNAEPRPGSLAVRAPEIVVWSVGRARQAAARWPSERWRPTLVLDLNYAENSPGREYAQRIGARYVGGLAAFRAQAEAQRRFWALQAPSGLL